MPPARQAKKENTMSGIKLEDAIHKASLQPGGNTQVKLAMDGALSVKGWLDEHGAFDNPSRLAALCGQTAHESGGYQSSIERLSYSAEKLMAVWPSRYKTLALAQEYARQPEKLANHTYAKRNGNGPPESGDGWRYRGRGWLMLTGRSNYRAVGKALGIDLVKEPDLARDSSIAWQIAVHFFNSRKRAGKTVMEWADLGDTRMVTRIINGGYHGLADRETRTQRAFAVLELTWPKG